MGTNVRFRCQRLQQWEATTALETKTKNPKIHAKKPTPVAIDLEEAIPLNEYLLASCSFAGAKHEHNACLWCGVHAHRKPMFLHGRCSISPCAAAPRGHRGRIPTPMQARTGGPSISGILGMSTQHRQCRKPRHQSKKKRKQNTTSELEAERTEGSCWWSDINAFVIVVKGPNHWCANSYAKHIDGRAARFEVPKVRARNGHLTNHAVNMMKQRWHMQ